jgi:adenylate cyclase
MSNNSLFAKEEAIIKDGRTFLENSPLRDAQDREAFENLFQNYQKLLKTTRRLMRLSDRNEEKLNQMAEEQRLVSTEIARKNRELETLSNKLAKYLSPQVYASIFEGKQEVALDSTRKKLTVFFSDIIGFTETTDKMESEDLTQLLNHYLTEMSQIAFEHGATIDKYIGDAIMIFFGDPDSRGVKQDALACVKMAIAMRERITELASSWRGAGFEKPLQCRMGIHTGYCTVGNFGSEDRMDYTIIGGSVNLASRLEHEASHGGILISYETYAQIRDEVDCEPAGQVHVKGLAYPITTYRVLDHYDKLSIDEKSVRVQYPYLTLDLNLSGTTDDDRAQAANALRHALARLEPEEIHNGSATTKSPAASSEPGRKNDEPAGKLGTVLSEVSQSGGATAEELAELTGWHPKTVRSAISRLRRRGHNIQLTTEKKRRVYRASLAP